MMVLAQKCICKYTEGRYATEINKNNKAVEITAFYTNTFSVAIWWFVDKFDAAPYRRAESGIISVSPASHIPPGDRQATTALQFENDFFPKRKPPHTQSNSGKGHSHLSMISYTCVIQNPFLTQTRQVFPGSVAKLPPPIIIRRNYVLKFPPNSHIAPKAQAFSGCYYFCFYFYKGHSSL